MGLSPGTGRRHVTTGTVTLLVTVLVVMSWTAWYQPTAQAQEQQRSFEIIGVATTASLERDSSMRVVERVTYRFRGGPFTVGIRSFESARDRITSFEVLDGDRRLEVDPPGRTPTGEWEWRFAEPLADTTRTFEVRYRVGSAAQVGPDVAELEWQFIGTDHPGVGAMTIVLDVPSDAPAATPEVADDDTGVIRAWGHGPAEGTVELLPGQVVATVTDVPAGQFVELRVVIPSAAFTVEPTGEPRLARILAEERSLIDDRSRADQRRDLGRWLALLAMAIGALATVLAWFRFGREPTPTADIGDYWREPLDDPPAVVLTNLRRGNVPAGDAIAATLLDLAQRGHLTITAERIERIGRDRTVHTFSRTDRPDDDLEPFERRLLEMVLRQNPSMSSTELDAWAKRNQSAAKSELDSWTALVRDEYRSRHWTETFSRRGIRFVAVMAAAMAALGAAALVLGSGWGWVALGAIVAAVGASVALLHNRTQEGADVVARAQALQRFLKDFSNLSDAPVGHLILWERFLVWSVALGVSSELMKGLATRLPQVTQDPSFAAFYMASAGASTRFDGLGDLGSTGKGISASFSPASNTSGSGGGFSSGGGGGGGGGGFGAR